MQAITVTVHLWVRSGKRVEFDAFEKQAFTIMRDHGAEIIEIRAGEGARLTLPEAYDIYRRSIHVAHQAAQQLQRGVRAHNASFLIQKLPWID